MTAKTCRLSPLAEQDLEAIWLYTFEHWNSDQADIYLRAIMGMFDALAAGTRTGRPVDVQDGYLKAFTGSHVIYYRDHGDYLAVIRVLH